MKSDNVASVIPPICVVRIVIVILKIRGVRKFFPRLHNQERRKKLVR